MLTLVTINILFDLRDWQRRRGLLVEGLRAARPDVIAVQEVTWPEDTGGWLAEVLGYRHVHMVEHTQEPYPGGPRYGNAILSRLPLEDVAELALDGQGRIAHRATVHKGQHTYTIANGHYYWAIGPDDQRAVQFRQLRDWLAEVPGAVLAAGDYNAEPTHPEVDILREQFASAYALANGSEPEFTCPTPLAKRNRRFGIPVFIKNMIRRGSARPWRGTLDYVFVRNATVHSAGLILNQPAPGSDWLYPSDHFGLRVAVEATA